MYEESSNREGRDVVRSKPFKAKENSTRDRVLYSQSGGNVAFILWLELEIQSILYVFKYQV